jgi:hypothetical protein
MIGKIEAAVYEAPVQTEPGGGVTTPPEPPASPDGR